MAHMPDAGNHFSSTAKTRISSRPSQKDGTEMPISTMKVMILSAQEYCRTAETTPAIRPKTEHRTREVPARISVAENRSSTSSMTGRLSV